MTVQTTSIRRPLYVDLDGTVLATDTLWESLLILLKKQPLTIFSVPLWLLRGKAFFKHQLAARVKLDPIHLPYREKVLSFLKAEKASGKELILASASDKRVAETIAHHLGIFSLVLGSDGVTNLSGEHKLRVIQQRTGSSGFEYIGNSTDDLPLWKIAHRAILVDPSIRTLRKAHRICSVQHLLDSQINTAFALIKALRVHQWVKNTLLFVPLLMAHKLTELDLVVQVLFAFMAFSLCASSMYIVNDLLDLETDRQHPIKRDRPFAAGLLQIKTGALLSPLLLIAAIGIALFLLPLIFAGSLVLYSVVATAYSWHLKHTVALDVFILAGLYTLRILAGAFSVHIVVSPWMLAFSMFLFLSLAFLKRYSELQLLREQTDGYASGRGYFLDDTDLLRSIGPASGYISVLILALYINSREVLTLYRYPSLLWLIAPCLLYWLTRIWFFAHRGAMNVDPVVFAINDRVSYILGFVVLALILLASS